MAKSKTHRNRRSRAEIQPRVGDLLRLPAGPVDLKAIATDATQGFMGAGKTDAKTAMRHLGRYHGFKKPTLEEREHHFLWRVKRQLPPPGIIGVFDVPTMRTWGWFGYMSSCRRRYGHAATASSIASRRSWWPRAPEW